MKLTTRNSASWKLETPSAYKGLSKEDKAFLKKFNNEAVYHQGLRSEMSLHASKELTKACDDEDNAARRCVMNKEIISIESKTDEDSNRFDFGSIYDAESEAALYDLKLNLK